MLFYVTSSTDGSILGRKACNDLNLVKRVYACQPRQCSCMTKEEMKQNYLDVFTGVGQYEKRYHTQLNPDVKGVIQICLMTGQNPPPPPPFTYCGVDCFGPFYTREGRKEYKRYGLLFTCMASRAVHIEILEDMTTDAFINALRCFIALRGAVKQLRSEQGSNFIAAQHELNNALNEVKNENIKAFLAEQGCNFLMNVPHASHMGGVRERQIRTTRSVLNTILHQFAGRLDSASLRTFYY